MTHPRILKVLKNWSIQVSLTCSSGYEPACVTWQAGVVKSINNSPISNTDEFLTMGENYISIL